MQRRRLVPAAAVLAAVIVCTSPLSGLAQSEDTPEPSVLSPYWSRSITQWELIIVQEAERRNLDPDFVAALIWKESMGRPSARGPAGAVGLMMVMPFPWRPSSEELENPWTNVFWGARVLATVIEDGGGDLYYSLAAYNGSWGQIHLGVTRRYAASVLDYYARALAVRHNLPKDGDWVAIFSVEGKPNPGTIIVVGPQRPLARYTDRPWGQANIPTLPAGVAPHATTAVFSDESGAQYRVNVWLVEGRTYGTMPPGVRDTFFLSPAGRGRSGLYAAEPPIMTPVPTPTPLAPTPFTATLATTPTATLTPTPLPTGTLSPTTTITAVSPLTATPTLTPPVPPLTITPPAECSGGPLEIDAWPLEKSRTEEGWRATIYVQGVGGDCLYTYAWSGDAIGGPTPGPVTFEVSVVGEDTRIIGTATVTSGGQTVERGLLIGSPKDD